MDYINIILRSYTIILFISTLSFIAGSNINCNGKAFHCVNSTHFKICVDLGGGVSMTVDEFLIPCPRHTVCTQYNLFECEYELTTTVSPVTIQSEVTNEQFYTSDNSVWEQLDITTIFPTKQQQGMELSEKYYNKVNATPASFTSSFLTDAEILEDPVTSGNTSTNTSNNSNIYKTLNISRSIDNRPDIGVSSNYDTTQNRRTLDSITSKSSKPLNQNSLDLDTWLTLTKKTSPVSSVSELSYSPSVALLPGNFSDSSLRENKLPIPNITHSIKSNNISRERNLDLFFIYNTTQRNNSNNIIQYSNTTKESMNSATPNFITAEKFISDVSNKKKESNVNSLITPEVSSKHLAGATTSNNPISLNAAVAIETFLNEGVNITTNLEKLSVSDGDFIILTSTTPETSVVKTNETWPKPIVIIVATDLDNNNITTAIRINNVTAGISNGVTSMKPLNHLISENETWPEPVVVTGETRLDNNNITTTETSKNITMEKYNGVTSFKPLPDLISKNVTWLESVVVIDETRLDNNNITTTETSENITMEKYNGVSGLKSLPDLISKNVTWPESVVVIDETRLDKNNITTTETSKNITIKKYNEVTSLKPLPDLISKNVTWPESVVVIDETRLDKNNITTTETSKNITIKKYNEVTSLKPLPDLISKNVTWPESVVVIGETRLDNNNITTTETSKNIIMEKYNGVTSFKPLPDLISNNETWPEPVLVIGETRLDNNNITTKETIKNITMQKYNEVTSLKPLPDLISRNETWPAPVVVIGETPLDNSNITTTETSKNITIKKYNEVTSLKPLPDLISKNVTWPESVVVIGETRLDNNNITTTETSKNITMEKYNGVTSLKPLPDLIWNNETWPEPVVVIGEIRLDNDSITTKETIKNITMEKYNGVTSLKPLTDLISKNVTWPESVVVIDETRLDNNNITTTETIKNITMEKYNGVTTLKPLPVLISKNVSWPESVIVIDETRLDNNIITTTETSKNITMEKYNGVTSFKPLPDLISNNGTWPEPVVVIGETRLDNNNITTKETIKNITMQKYNEVTSLKPLPDLISRNETWPAPVVVIGETPLDNSNITTTETSKNTTMEKYNGVTSLKSLPDMISKNETWPESVVAIGETPFDDSNMATTETSKNVKMEKYNGVTSLKLLPDLISKNETWPEPVVVIGERRLDNNNITTKETIKNMTMEMYKGVTSLKPLPDLISKNETWPKPIMMTVATDLDNNNLTTTEQSNNITVEISNEVSSLKSILDINLTTTKIQPTDFKLLIVTETFDDFHKDNIFRTTSATFTDHQSLNEETTSLSSLSKINDNNFNPKNFNTHSVGLISSTDLNYTDKLISPVSSNHKSMQEFAEPLLTNIYNVSPRNFGEYISPTRAFDKTTASNKHKETGDQESNQTNQNGLRIIGNGGNKAEYLLPNPYTQFTTTTIAVNDTTRTLKESSYNFSKPSLTVINNIKKDFFVENITLPSADKNTAPKDFYDTKGIGFNKSNSRINKLVNINNYKNRTGLADYFPLSEFPNNHLSGNVVKPLLIAQEPLEKVNNASSLQKDNENVRLINDHGFQEHISERINKSKISEINTLNRSGHFTPVKNITSSNNFSEDSINYWRIVNTLTVAKPPKTFRHDKNASEVKSLCILRTRENFTNDLNATRKTSITTNNLIRIASSLTNSIKNNKTHDVLSLNALNYLRIPAEHDKSSQNTGPSNILNKPKLELISEQDRITISEPPRYVKTNLSNIIEEQQLRNGHGNLVSLLTFDKDVTKNIGNNAKNNFTTQINSILNNSNAKYGNTPSKQQQQFNCTNRGKYSDTNDCNKFYVCIGRVKPIIGVCPTGTVFSEFLKQCTKNVTHCIRNNQFKCTASGRFINILCNNTFFICAKKKNSFIRFTLQCQRGYYLDKYSLKCAPKLKNISISDEKSFENTKESFHKEMEEVSVNSKNVFECDKEGKFKDPQDCRKYYICKKGRKSTFRRQIKKCDSDEVFHGKKKKCVDVESYECDI